MRTPITSRKPGRSADSLSPAPIGFRWPFRRRAPTPGVRHAARYEGVLGTALELQILADTPQSGTTAEAAVLVEIDRLERVFSAYHADSELRRWQETHDTDEAVSPELAAGLQAAETWRQRTDNAFHPAVEALTHLWREGAERGEAPDGDALERMVTELRTPLWDVDATRQTARRRTRLPITLNALAKGFIIDAACGMAMRQPGVRAALVNIGGDIRHAGDSPVPVAVADPFAPQDNAAPLATVRVVSQGVATSGNYRRGFRVGDRWHSHLLDPRTGYPAENVVSASVIADSAQMADVLTTAFSVMRPEESLRLADGLPGVGALIVTQDGVRHANGAWRKHAL